MAANQKKPSNTARNKTGNKPASKRTNSQRKSTSTRSKAGYKKEQTFLHKYKDEISILVTLVVGVILVLSNFNLSGAAGKFINRFTFGLFGLEAYLLPYCLFFGIAFLISNRGNRQATIKLISCIGLFVMVAAFIQLVSIDFNEDWTIFSYYTNSATNRNGGGFVGGIIYSIMYPLFGFFGSLVIMLAISILLLMFITEKMFFASLSKKSARKISEWKERREEVKREREEECDDYEEDTLSENLRQEDAFAHNGRAERGKKAERSKKVRTYTFPKEEQKLSNQQDKPKATDSQAFNSVLTESAKVREESVPLTEVKPFDFDSIAINRADEVPTYGNEDAAIYEEEMKRKFSSSKDYDIKKLAEQIMNESFDGKSTLIEETEFTDPVEEVQTEKLHKESTVQIEQPTSEVQFGEESEQEDINFEDYRVDLKAFEQDKETDAFDSSFEETEVQNQGKEPVREDALAENRGLDKQEVFASTEPKSVVTEVETVVEKPFVYEFPPVELLTKPKKTNKGISNQELKETALKLQKTLQSFGVGVTITNVSCGPAVTRYELQPEQGVKVSKITNLADDIKLNLAAADIRIEAPIPGKAAVGIEVPNKENTAVMFRELIECREFKEHPSDVAFAVGKDIGGQVVVGDIGKMPHLLIAGATGSGKSVCINTIIMSILYKADPRDVKLIMIDPKVVELSVYNGIPHLLIPVVTDPKKASSALNWAVLEMTERYNRFAELGVRDIKGFNKKIEKVKDFGDKKYEKMPQIVIIVDELADLMMVAPGEVEDAICRLAQMARAAGLHLIIATQRPSVNVITGVIKANVPSRIAFSVSSAIDSRTIIDGSGAEKLLGKGDMLFFPSGYPKPVRIQGAFVSDKEVSAVVDFVASQQNKPTYNEDITNTITKASTTDATVSGGSNRDDYFVEAGKFIIDKNKASIGMLQRVYKIGFNRAARIMDQLYEAGVVGPEEGTKPRKVLMSEEEFEQYVDEYV